MAKKRQVYEVQVTRNVEAVMRDGVVLRADIARPKARGRFPVILERTPYGKEVPAHLAAAGYVVITQDMRGCYASDGELTWMFMPGYRDAEDGYDTVEWAAGLPFSNGKVGALGFSYLSWAAWELASLRPPHLVAMFNGAFATRLTDWEVGGVFRTGRALKWLFGHGADQRRRKGMGGYHTSAEVRAASVKDREKALWFVPLKEMPNEYVEGLREDFIYWLDHQNEDYFNFCERHCEVDVPVFHTTGWADRLVLTVDHFTGMQKNGRTEMARENQRIILGPWSHAVDGHRKVGEMDFGRRARVDFNKLIIRWFDYWLKGIENRIMKTAPVRYFVMGENRWYEAETWPLPEARPTAYFFHSRGSANTPSGDGRLSRRAPGREASDRYAYDPRDPVMTLFYENCQDAPYDQRQLDGREDVLVYQTQPLRKPVRVVGRPEVRLFAASSALDTDFVVKLIDVHPDGFAHQVCYGIVRARYRKSFDRPKLLRPGRVYEYTIQMLPTGNLFQAGHRIRVAVSSSDFPNFDRNHNTGGDDYGEATFKVAHQEVFHDAQRSSRVVLSVVP